MNNKLERIADLIGSIKAEVGKVIIGQEKALEMSLISIFAGQHALIEGVPGIAKTLLVKTLAKIMDCEFSRIQFTPDLMPADITGTNMFNIKENSFFLVKGPIFTTFLLADEINRAPAKTQSALLQAMQERMVSIDCETYQLSTNFTVFATQNPIEYEGTYPLPEAQKDRFMLKIVMDYPSKEEELFLAKRMLTGDTPENTLESSQINKLLPLEELNSLKKEFCHITLEENLMNYIVDIIRITRNHEAILVGAGPRATQSLILASRILALLNNRDYVTPDDIKNLAPPVLSHRLIMRPEFEVEGVNMDSLIHKILDEVSVPR